MPGYTDKLQAQINHPPPNKPQHTLHRWTQPAYSQRIQYAPQLDVSCLLDKKGIKFIQSTTGSLLYYSRALDPTILPALNEISTSQATPTELTKSKVTWLLDFIATYLNVKIHFYKSNMVLHADSDAAYLVLPQAHSRFAGHFFLSSKPSPPPIKPSSP